MKNKYISSVWDFTKIKLNETNYITHDFLRWYGKLIPQLVSKLIELYSIEGDTILANFCGSGTVPLEAKVLKRNCIGIDSSPLAILLSTVKTTPYIPDNQSFTSLLSNYSQESKYLMDEEDLKWYDEKTFADLMRLKEIINNINNPKDKNYYFLALAAITRKVSRIDSRCINHIVVDNNKPTYNVLDIFMKQVKEMNVSMGEFIEIAKNDSNISILNGDARELSMIKDNSIDLIISHPPYLGYINYSNIYKLANKILGHEYSEVKKTDISTNSLKKYIEDMNKVFDEMFRVLKEDKYACVIIGDNRVNGDLIPTFSYFIEYACKLGFKLKDIFIWVMSQKAGMSVKRRGNHIDHNYILIFQKS